MRTKITVSVLLAALLLGNIIFPGMARAARPTKEDATAVLKTYSGTVNGVKRELVLVALKDGKQGFYVKSGERETDLIWIGVLEVGFDKYGANWFIEDGCLMWCSYDLEIPINYQLNDINVYPMVNSNDIEVYDAESLEFDETGKIVTGYKDTAGEIHPLLSFDVMKLYARVDIPEPQYIPDGMTAPNTPTPDTPSPTLEVVVTETPVPNMPTKTPEVVATETPIPNAPTLTPEVSATETPMPETPTPTPENASKRLTIKTEKKTKILYEGDEKLGQYSLKKGVLTWKGQKKGKVRGVKYAGFIKKSRNIVYISKKGKAYTVSLKTGKKKLIIKKKARKFIYSGKFVTKIKTASGKVTVSNQ